MEGWVEGRFVMVTGMRTVITATQDESVCIHVRIGEMREDGRYKNSLHILSVL